MLLFWLDRVDALSNVATHLDRRVADYIRDNVYITSSGTLPDRLLRHALDFTSIDRILFSTDYPSSTTRLGGRLGRRPDDLPQRAPPDRGVQPCAGSRGPADRGDQGDPGAGRGRRRQPGQAPLAADPAVPARPRGQARTDKP